MFKLLPGRVYVGNSLKNHVGPKAKFNSKEVKPKQAGGAGCNMRIIENNEQFLPFCIIHFAQNTGDFDENDNSTRTHVSVNNFFFHSCYQDFSLKNQIVT